MLSTSILYCNKIDEQQCSLNGSGFDDGHHHNCTTTNGSSSNCSHHNHHETSPNNHNHHHHFTSPSIHHEHQITNRSCHGSQTSKSVAGSSAISGLSRTSDLNHSRYRVQYLGCNTCDYRSHKPENGIATYQKPLLDLYSAVLRRSVVLRSLLSVNQVADLSSHGIFIAEKDRFQTVRQINHRPASSASATSNKDELRQNTVVTKVITPISNILLWAAVRLQHRTHMRKIKNSAIKRRQIGAAFVPLSCSEAVLDKNAFVTLNSKQRFLLGLPHPPLFVCVLQKVNSNQRLECHLFVCGSSDDAIRMCNRMDELRQRASSIGRLHVPLPGQMGKYSYQNRHSTTSSILSRSYPSSQTMSELSIVTSSRPRFSDIEEEDDEQETEVKKLIDNYQSNINSANSLAKGIKMVSCNELSGHNNNNNNNNNGHNNKIKCDARLYDRTRVICKAATNGLHQQHSMNGSISWPSELSSISSKSISTNNLDQTSTKGQNVQGLIAKRDYRFESYKGASDSTDGLPAINNQKNQILDEKISPTNQQKSFKWINANDELHRHRLFAKASAKANDEPHSPSGGHELNQQIEPMKNGVDGGIPAIKTTTFFGDSLRGNKHLKSSGSPSPRSKNQNESKQQQSIISNSIFLDNEDDKSSSKTSSKDGRQKSRKNKINSNGLNDRNYQEMDNYNKKTIECLPHNGNHHKQRQTRDVDKPLKLYLPESNTNLGVKGFNKSSRVETWSTMIASSSSNAAAAVDIEPEANSCDLCQMELNCDECCSFCQAIEQHKRQYCSDCIHENDDFILDDMTMEHFNMNTNSPRPHRTLHRSDSIQHGDPSFFSRIRRLSWQSLFGSRKKLNGSRIWSRLRTGSQRLRGSKRYFQNKSRIFLPNSTNHLARMNGKMDKKNHYHSYDEHYLKPPMEQSKQPVLSSSMATNRHENEPFIETKKTLFDNTRMNGKITETNNINNNNDVHKMPFNGDVNIVGKKNGATNNVKQLNTTAPITNIAKLSNNVIQTKKLTMLDNQQKTMPDLQLTTNENDHRRRNILLTDNAEYLLNQVNNNKDVENIIKPFFISHPGKHSANELHLDGKLIELGLNGISISSDSGMEEYDCHSSAEHSPSGYQHNGHHYYNNKHQHRQKSSVNNYVEHSIINKRNNNFLSDMFHEQQQKTSITHHRNHQQTMDKTLSANKQYEKQTDHEQMMKKTAIPMASKDIRRQAGHWSNLESQLGYMP